MTLIQIPTIEWERENETIKWRQDETEIGWPSQIDSHKTKDFGCSRSALFSCHKAFDAIDAM